MSKPKLRFKEFYDEWNDYLLKDISVITMGQSPNSENYTNDSNDTLLIQGNADLSNGFVVPRLYTKQITKTCDINDIIMTVRAPVGDIAITKYNACIGRGVCSIKGDKYIYHYLDYLKNRDYWKKISKGSTIDSITSEDIKNLNIMKPCEQESIKITKCIDLLNKKIELQSKKIEDLKLFTKKIIIDILNGENTYNSKLFKDVCTIQTGKSNTQDKDENGKYPFYIRSENIEHSSKYIFDCEAVITIGDGNIGKVFFYENGKFDCHQRVYVLNNFKEVTGKYLYYYFSTYFYKRAISMSAKNTVDSVRMEMISDMEIKYPVKEEQQRITKIFDKLEKKQKLEEKKLKILINLKKGLMQNMFV